MSTPVNPCLNAVSPQCDVSDCKKTHCRECRRHLCPVCNQHYKMLIYSDSEDGCCGACVKVTKKDFEPFYPGRRKANA